MNFILMLTMTLFAFDQENSTTTLNGKWKLIKYYNLTDRTSESEPTNIYRSIIINFSDNGSKGEMNGYTETNSVFGDYELQKDNKMRTLCIGGTKIGEPYWGSKFWDAIRSASSYEREIDQLFIYFNQ